jgi:hypothetical protein
MDTNRNKSIVLFVMMGGGFLIAILYAFVIAPNSNKNTLGSTDPFLELPVQKWNLRYSRSGVTPFCEEDSTSLLFEVAEDTAVYSAADGVVLGVDNNVVSIEVFSNVFVEEYPVSNTSLIKGDYVKKGDPIGSVDGEFLNLRINNTRSEVYECPYNFLNSFGKSIVDDTLELMEYDGDGCECAILSY